MWSSAEQELQDEEIELVEREASIMDDLAHRFPSGGAPERAVYALRKTRSRLHGVRRRLAFIRQERKLEAAHALGQAFIDVCRAELEQTDFEELLAEAAQLAERRRQNARAP